MAGHGLAAGLRLLRWHFSPQYFTSSQELRLSPHCVVAAAVQPRSREGFRAVVGQHADFVVALEKHGLGRIPVSYTLLTLPTIGPVLVSVVAVSLKKKQFLFSFSLWPPPSKE